MNVVSKDAIKLLDLTIEPHPNPFRIAWVNDYTLPVTQRYLVFIQMGDYKDEIYCDVATHGCCPCCFRSPLSL